MTHPSTIGRSGPARQLVPFAAATMLGLDIGVTLWRERFEIVTLLLALVATVLLLISTRWWSTRRVLAGTIVLNLAVLFTFLWSLDERERVVIHDVNGQYTGQIGSASVTIPQHIPGGRFGLYASPLIDYHVYPTGEAPPPQSDTLLTRFGEWMRLAFGPAWTNIRVTANGKQIGLSSSPTTIGGSWGTNRRGEYSGTPGSSVLLGTAPQTSYTIEADLMRGDGTQGVVLGVDSANQGDLFAPRIDQPDMLWLVWSNGTRVGGLGASGTRLALTPMIQRDLRLLLANVFVAQILLVFALPLYFLLLTAFRRVGGTSEEELRPLERLLDRPRLVTIAAIGTALAATIVTALIASELLERIPHVQDSVADLFQAKTLALGRLWVPQPKLATFFSEEFIPAFDGRWFGKYPPGWPLLLAAGVLVHVPWLVDPLLAGADVMLIYLIGREVYTRRVGLIAALLTLSSPFFLFLGGSFMAHTSALFYLSGAAYLFIRWDNRNPLDRASLRSAWHLLLPAGFLLGMGFITRQLDSIAFALPFGVLLVPRLIQRQLWPAVWLILGGIGPVVAMLLYNWDLTGSPLTSPYSLWWPSDRVGFGPNVGMGGFTLAGGLWNTSFNVQMLLAHLFGWPFFLTLALVGVPFLTGHASRWDAVFLASALAVIAAYVAYWNPGVMYGPRYYYVAIPWFALLSARGLQELYLWPLRISLTRNHDRLAALASPAVLVVLLLTYNLAVYMPTQIPLYRGYNYTSAASIDAVQRSGIHHALIFVVSNPPYEWWSYGEVFSSNSPLLDGDIVYARDEGASDHQLMAQYPGRSYYLLNDTTLTRLSG